MKKSILTLTCTLFLTSTLLMGFGASAAIELRGDKITGDSVTGTIVSIGMANTADEVTRIVVNITPSDQEKDGTSLQVLFSGDHYQAGVAASANVGKCVTVVPGPRLQSANLVFRASCE